MTHGMQFWKGAARHHRRCLKKLETGRTPKYLKIEVTPKEALPQQAKNKWKDAIITCEKEFVRILKDFHKDKYNEANFNIKKNLSKLKR